MKTFDVPPPLARTVPALMVILPLSLVVTAYVFAIQPRFSAAQRASAKVTSLQNRLVGVQSVVRGAPSARAGGDQESQREFEQRTPDEDRVSDVLEALARLADGTAEGKVQNLLIETGDRVEPPAPQPAGSTGPPRVAGPQVDAIDPRIGLFRTPVAYTLVTMTVEATYPQLGRFFWNLRNLPTTFEIRTLEIGPSADAPLLRVKLAIFAFQRSGQTAPRQVVLSDRPSPRAQS